MNIIDLNKAYELIGSCRSSYSKGCLMNDLSILIKEMRGVSTHRQRINLCISDPSDAAHCDGLKCSGDLLCIKDIKDLAEMGCPDLVICYENHCSFIEIKSHIKNNKSYVTRLERVLKNVERKFNSCESLLENKLRESGRFRFSNKCSRLVYLNIKLPEDSYFEKYRDRFVIIEKDLNDLVKEFIERCIKRRR